MVRAWLVVVVCLVVGPDPPFLRPFKALLCMWS